MTIPSMPRRGGLWLPALLCAFATGGPTAPLQAQVKVSGMAETLCSQPPMAIHSLDRLKRRGDYMRLLEELADRCPEVAMIFLDFEVGSIDDRAEVQRRDPDEFVDPMHWPPPSDRNF